MQRSKNISPKPIFAPPINSDFSASEIQQRGTVRTYRARSSRFAMIAKMREDGLVQIIVHYVSPRGYCLYLFFHLFLSCAKRQTVREYFRRATHRINIKAAGSMISLNLAPTRSISGTLRC